MPPKNNFDSAGERPGLEFLKALRGDVSKVSAVGRSRQERRLLAQAILETGEEAENPLEMLHCVLRAVRVDPGCLPARTLLATLAGGPAEELIEEFQQIVSDGEADLGPEFMAENQGHFWLIGETRPYMSARARLAQLLSDAGRLDEAIAHYEALLVLNPGDNQGLRYPLLASYLQTGRLGPLGKLFEEYDEESALFLWGRVLEQYLLTDFTKAAVILKKARKENRYVEDLLTGRRSAPNQMPDYYGPGDRNEAAICADSIGKAWARYPEAVAWLSRQRPSGKKPASGKTKSKPSGYVQ